MSEIEIDGIRYHVEETGNGRPLVLLHGFTGNSSSWQHLIPEFAASCRVIAVDLPGHGRTEAPQDTERFAFGCVVDDLAAITRDLAIDCAIWAGYSMGGRVALAFAIEHPSLVSGLILESASPGLVDASARAERRQRDAELAASIERHGVPHFVADWERLPLWASQASLHAEARSRQRAIRLSNSARGLAGSLRGMGTGSQPSFWERLPELEQPVLVLAGQEDTKFAQIATEMSAVLPNAQLGIIPGAGHAIHLERPQHYLELVSQFVDEVPANVSIRTEEEVA